MTYAWLVYRMEAGKPMILGLFKSEEVAKENIEVMGDDDWEIEAVHFIGWGIERGH